ncbi:MAG TPA: T9SS type A sorting domain-containing protein [Bacteroidia bacterium]|jgi:hypothetical protein|nr:T9SS type A sorting domain-containing protein [Bacteroidia bacterium]
MKKIITLLALALVTLSVNAQTNVSGGIFANTNWTLAGSPYIVTANTVLFPGYTLTIDPGVTVKFDAGVSIEIRQAALIALGTSTDSIWFTSNGAATANTWDKVYLNGGVMDCKFAYCNFTYATDGLFDNRGASTDSLLISHCNFHDNGTGYTGTGTGLNCGIVEYSSFTHNYIGGDDVYGTTFNYDDFSWNTYGVNTHNVDVFNHCTITHNSSTGVGNIRNVTMNYCTISNNAVGLNASNGLGCNYCTIDSNSTVGVDAIKTVLLLYNVIDYNLVGIYDHNSASNPCNIRYNAINANGTGIHLTVTTDSIVCNHICDNTTYDLAYGNANNIRLDRNYWCVPDSASLQPFIYDAHDNITYGVVNYMPMDDGSCSVVTAVPENHSGTIAISIYPNPVNNDLSLELPSNVSEAKIRIYNSLGALCFTASTTESTTHIDVSNFASGLYFVEVEAGANVARQKFVKN